MRIGVATDNDLNVRNEFTNTPFVFPRMAEVEYFYKMCNLTEIMVPKKPKLDLTFLRDYKRDMSMSIRINLLEVLQENIRCEIQLVTSEVITATSMSSWFRKAQEGILNSLCDIRISETYRYGISFFVLLFAAYFILKPMFSVKG